jgi:uncharacterized membrane protein
MKDFRVSVRTAAWILLLFHVMLSALAWLFAYHVMLLLFGSEIISLIFASVLSIAMFLFAMSEAGRFLIRAAEKESKEETENGEEER